VAKQPRNRLDRTREDAKDAKAKDSKDAKPPESGAAVSQRSVAHLSRAPANENAGNPTPRKSERVELRVEIGIDDHTNFYVGFSENLSAGGLFVATYTLMPIGTPIALTFVLPNELPMFVQAQVRWQRTPKDVSGSDVPPGMGLEFQALGAAETSRIQAYIEGRVPLYHGE
jgi:uncharacterized protein (TIGR02266 family)